MVAAVLALGAGRKMGLGSGVRRGEREARVLLGEGMRGRWLGRGGARAWQWPTAGRGVVASGQQAGARGSGARCHGWAVSCKPLARQWFWLGHSQVAGQLAAPAYGPAGRHGAGKERRERGSMAFS